MSDWSSDVCSSDLFDRSTDEEMVVEIAGRWCEYRLFFVWQQDLSAMYFSCLFDLRAPPQKRTAVAELLALVNEKMWLGHFDLCSDELDRKSTRLNSSH